MKTEPNPITRTALFLAVTFGITFLITDQSVAQRAEDIIFTPQKIRTIPGHGMSKAEYPYDEGGKYRKEWVNTWAKSPVSASTTVRNPIPKTSNEHSNYPAIAQLQNQSALRQHLQQQTLIAKTHRSRSNQQHAIATPPQTRQVAFTPPKPKPQATQVYSVPKFSSEAQLIQNGFIGPYDRMAQPARQRTAPKPAPIVVARNTRTAPQQYSAPIVVARNTQTAPQQYSAAPSSPSYHKVKSGDTLYNISRRYGTTIDSIKHANGLTSDLIRVGQNLRLAFAQNALGVPRG